MFLIRLTPWRLLHSDHCCSYLFRQQITASLNKDVDKRPTSSVAVTKQRHLEAEYDYCSMG